MRPAAPLTEVGQPGDVRFDASREGTMSYPPGPPQDGDPTPESTGSGSEERPAGSYGGAQQPYYGQEGSYQPGYGEPGYGFGQQALGQQAYGQQAYGQYPPPYGPPVYGPGLPATNGKATASLVTGIATLVLSWCCGLGLLGIVAVVLGVKARAEIRNSGGHQAGDGLALAGIITGVVAAVLGLAILVILAIAIATGHHTGSSFRSAYYNS
jgi:hypothetical protein